VYGEDGDAAVASVIPMQRMAVPTDIARTCLYLSSDLFSYVTGAGIAVHGGGELPARYLAIRHWMSRPGGAPPVHDDETPAARSGSARPDVRDGVDLDP
jgi:Enoyl-(Acyl carrier protein) reductase